MQEVPKKVLIVEDNELNTKLFSDLLTAQGYDSMSVQDGAQVLQAVQSYKPDLILMDIQIPNISGLQVTRQLKKSHVLSHIPVVAVTAFAMEGDEEKIREGGCQGYLSKPISVTAFLDTVRHFLN